MMMMMMMMMFMKHQHHPEVSCLMRNSPETCQTVSVEYSNFHYKCTIGCDPYAAGPLFNMGGDDMERITPGLLLLPSSFLWECICSNIRMRMSFEDIKGLILTMEDKCGNECID